MMSDPSSPTPVSDPLQLSLLSDQSRPQTSTSVHSPPVSTNTPNRPSGPTTRTIPSLVLPENATRYINSPLPLPALQSNRESFPSAALSVSNLDSIPTQYPPLSIPAALHTRIDSLQKDLAKSQTLSPVLKYLPAQSPTAFVTLDPVGKLCIPGRLHRNDLIIVYGYPRTDNDADYCLEDVPGLSVTNFQTFRSSLVSHLVNIRRAAHQSAAQVENMLIEQTQFRAVPKEEVNRLFQSVVGRFCKARRMVLHKFRAYVRNVRWIENVATRQRKGCLTHQQNNTLRTWLFQNFDNPYPNNADKKKLMQDTHLSATQVNNWLINARSRVWKPTVDIMSRDCVQKEMMRMEQWCATMKEKAVLRDEGYGISVTSQNDSNAPHLKLTSNRRQVCKTPKSRRERKNRAASPKRAKKDVDWLGRQQSNEGLKF